MRGWKKGEEGMKEDGKKRRKRKRKGSLEIKEERGEREGDEARVF